MAILVVDDQQQEVTDGDALKEAAEELGVPFGCEEGICGSCLVDVVEGLENLAELTEAEEDMGLDEGERLMCQCKVNSGTVKIQY